MLTILLVATEMLEIERIQKVVLCKKDEFCIVGQALNEQEALKLYSALRPDVIIIDGDKWENASLKLIGTLRKRCEKAEIIIVSENREFEYVRQALNYRVCAFILKPAKDDEIINALNDIKDNIEINKKNTQIIKKYLDQRRERKLTDIITGNINSERVVSELGKLKIEVPNRTFSVAIIQTIANEKEEISAKVFSEVIDCELGQSMNYAIRHNIDPLTVVLVIFIRRHYEFHNGCKPIERIIASLSKSVNGKVYAGVSNSFNDISEISAAYKQAKKTIDNIIFLDRQKIAYYADIVDVVSAVPRLTISEIDKIFQSLKTDGISANKIIDDYFERIYTCSYVDVSDIKHMAIELYIFLAKFIIEDEGSMELFFGRRVNFISEVWQIDTIKDIKLWIKNIINDLCKSRNTIVPSIYSSLIQSAIEYISKNYKKKISIKHVAETLRVSSGHLMRTFKKETGKSFIEYLTEYRIYLAKILLAKGEYKIYEVANMVGYKDPKYFCRIFKKITKTSPGTDKGR